MRFALVLLAFSFASVLAADDVGLGPVPTNTALVSPGPSGPTTPNTGAFTTLMGSTSITDGGLTSTRMTYAGIAGLLSDSGAT